MDDLPLTIGQFPHLRLVSCRVDSLAFKRSFYAILSRDEREPGTCGDPEVGKRQLSASRNYSAHGIRKTRTSCWPPGGETKGALLRFNDYVFAVFIAGGLGPSGMGC